MEGVIVLIVLFIVIGGILYLIHNAKGNKSHIDKGYIYFAMAFSFGVEMLNMWMLKRAKKQKVQLNEPIVKKEEQNSI